MSFASYALTRNHTLGDLIADLGPARVLDREEEAALGSVIQSADLPSDLRDQAIRCLMNHNIRLVIRQARKLRLPGEDIGELVSNGTFGLRRAAERFDPARGFKFSTYACWWIRQSIERARQKEANGRPWRVPVHVHGHRSRCETLRRRLAAEGVEITLEEAAERLGLQRFVPHFWAIDSILFQEAAAGGNGDPGGGGENTSSFRLDELPGEDDEAAAERRDQMAAIERLLPRLPAQERRVIRLYYGFDEVPGIRRATGQVADKPGGLIARHLGICRERVRQIRQSALTKLRRWAEEENACS